MCYGGTRRNHGVVLVVSGEKLMTDGWCCFGSGSMSWLLVVWQFGFAMADHL